MKSLNENSVFEYIAESAYYGNLGFFIGSGFTKAVFEDPFGDNIALSWKELLKKAALELETDIDWDSDQLIGCSYPDIASTIIEKIILLKDVSEEEAARILKIKISKLTSWYPEKTKREKYAPIFQTIDPSWIITTNYDLVIECMLSGKCVSLGPYQHFSSNNKKLPVYHIHGMNTNPDSIILTRQDYVSMFRPNEYRQLRLALTLTESTVVFIGYSLNDINVLTAVDWANNVFDLQKNTIPNKIIQLLYSENPKSLPYYINKGVLIYEFNDLFKTLLKISNHVEYHKHSISQFENSVQEFNQQISNSGEDIIQKFIDEEEFRNNLLKSVNTNESILSSGFLEFFVKVTQKAWENAMPNGAFEAYNDNLKVTLDTLNSLNHESTPPALFEAIAFNLERLSWYLGNNYGDSFSANNTWNMKSNTISEHFVTRLSEFAKAHDHKKLLCKLNEIYNTVGQ